MNTQSVDLFATNVDDKSAPATPDSDLQWLTAEADMFADQVTDSLGELARTLERFPEGDDVPEAVTEAAEELVGELWNIAYELASGMKRFRKVVKAAETPA